MQLIDIRVVQGRVNSILLLIEEDRDSSAESNPVYAGVKELAAGLDFYAEAPRPERSANTAPRSRKRRKARR